MYEWALRIQTHLWFIPLMRLRELIIVTRVLLYQVGAITLAIGLTIEITVQAMVHVIVHTIAIVQ